MKNNYPSRYRIDCIDFFVEPENIEGWMECPKCNFKPRVWEFDNGRFTACACANNAYDHFSVKAKPIMQVIREDNGSAVNYDRDELRKNWNEYCTNHPTKGEGN